MRQRVSLASIMHLGRARLLLFVSLFLALSVAVPWFIYDKVNGQPLSLDERWLSWPFVLSVLLLLSAYYLFDGLRLYFTLRALGRPVPLRELTPLVFINLLVSNITPMATGGGLAQVWYLRRHRVPVGTATAATTLRTLQAVAFIFLPAPLILLFLPALQGNPLGEKLPFWLGLFAFVYVGFFTIVLYRIRWVAAFSDRLLALLARYHLLRRAKVPVWRFRLHREMIRFTTAVGFFLRGGHRDIALALLCTAGFLLALFSFPALLLHGLGYSIAYLTSIALLLVTTFIMYFSPTPGAAGVAEGVFGLFFVSQVGNHDLVLVILAWRFLTIYLGMLVGIPVLLRALMTGSRSDG